MRLHAVLTMCATVLKGFPAISRARHTPAVAAAGCAGQRMFVHGGQNSLLLLEDLFVLDLRTREWREIMVAPGPAPSPRHSHSMGVADGRLFMFGGYDEMGLTGPTMYCMQLPADDSHGHR